MVKEIKIEEISVSLSNENGNVRVKSIIDDVILNKQDIDTVCEIIKGNFDIVYSHYKHSMRDSREIDCLDINIVSISIVLHYLYMYNSWRNNNKRQQNIELRFRPNDFNNPTTHDILIDYFKRKYREGWEVKCSILLEMEVNDFLKYYEKRLEFYNK